ncbi:MAG TPA: VWA domain-containing protein [Myxococcota bacterium]|jgi:Mg-chelatase subunit ChlD|nr:VWA domain-containing protein [Myxococcota bacterium]
MSDLFIFLDRLVQPWGIRLGSEAGLYVLVVLPLLWLSARGVKGEGPRWYVRLPLLLVRTAGVLLLAAALMQPVRKEKDDEPEVAVAVDVSGSVGDAEVAAAAARLTAIAAHPARRAAILYPFAFDRAAWPVYLDPAHPAAVFARGPDAAAGSNPARALSAALGRFTPDFDHRVLLVTDGLETEGDVVATAAALRAAGATVSVMPTGGHGAEVVMRRLAMPSEAALGEKLLATVEIDDNGAAAAGPARVTLVRSGGTPLARTVELVPGPNRFTFETEARPEGDLRFSATVDGGAGDSFHDDDTAWAAVHVRGLPKVLLVREPGEAEETHLARTLLKVGTKYSVREITRDKLPATLAGLDEYDLVVFNDPKSTEVGDATAKLLGTWVGELGGGMVVSAGERAKDLAEEGETEFEKLLPLTFRRVKKKEKVPLAVCFVIDKSASMGRDDKFVLAVLAVQKAVAEMKDDSEVAIILFDDFPKVVLPRTKAKERKLIEAILPTLTIGGGTDMFPAMRAAHAELVDSPAKLRHMIVLSDGESISRLAHMRDIVDKIVRDHITISTVALSKDSDPGEMEAVAKLGGGHFYYIENPKDIPKIFAKETQSTTETTVVKEEFHPVPLKTVDATEGIDFAAAPPLGGYLASKKRDTTELILESDRKEPLLARWQYGLGRVTVWTSDARPGWAASWMDWEGFGRLWDGLVRTTMRSDRASHIVTRGTVSREGEAYVEVVDLLGGPADDEETRPAPTLALVGPAGAAERTLDVPIAARGRGVWAATFALPGPGGYALRAERAPLVRGSTPERAFGSIDWEDRPEHARAGDAAAVLAAIARAGGGKVYLDPADAGKALFASGTKTREREVPLWPPLVWLAIGLFFLDVLLRRLA